MMRSHPLRTTLTIDDGVMQAVRVLARQQGSSLGAPVDLELVNRLRDELP